MKLRREHDACAEVLTGERTWHVAQADCLAWLDSLPADSVDLVFGSPPYSTARTYGIGFNLDGQGWVDWMVAVYHACLRVCRGLVAFVVDGVTRKFSWSGTPHLLAADLLRSGVTLRHDVFYNRVGIPGSGGPDFLRNDCEFILCATRGGKLPWSDNTAMGHAPRWAPGGAMSHRRSNGTRVNQWGRVGSVSSNSRGERPSSNRGRHAPSHRMMKNGCISGYADGDTKQNGSYQPPELANPGNVIKCLVGGNLMGSKLAHLNEAPFPELLPEFFVRSFCPPGGLVADCFSGSGTTGAVSVRWGRRFLGCDVRRSQVSLSGRRIRGEVWESALSGA